MKQLANKNMNSDPPQNKAGGFGQMDAYIKAVQDRLANYLQKKTNCLTNRKKKMLLLLFMLLFGGGSIAVLCYSFMTISVPAQTPAFTLPKYYPIHKPNLCIRDSLITQNEYNRIKQFKHYLERLQEDATGKKIYDSLIQARPYLLDSIHKVDSIFLNQ
jgi:hypothetical protein